MKELKEEFKQEEKCENCKFYRNDVRMKIVGYYAGEPEWLDFELSECRLYPQAVDVRPSYWCGQHEYN